VSTSESFENAWEAYQGAVDELYNAPAEAIDTVDRSAGEIYAERLDQRSDRVLARAEQVRSALASSLQTEDLGQRELAGLKLVAAAAYDLSVANDLLELERAGPTGEVERAARGAVLASDDLRSVLHAPLEEGMLSLLEVERSVLPNESQAARVQLEKTIASFLRDIPKDAGALSQTAVGGAIGTVANLGPVQNVASLAAQEILARVPHGLSFVARRAANLVVEAISKLQTAFGEEQEKQVRNQVSRWLGDILEERNPVIGLLDKLYETRRLSEETTKLVEAAPEGTEATRYNQATRELEELLARYSKTRSTLDWLMRILALASTPLLAAAPWGPAAVYTAYASVLGYAIYSGGDYLDWYRMGSREWLDRVEGLRTTVRRAL
jgi:hypothetical protein